MAARRPGGCDPTSSTLGKSFAGGIPIGAYGLSAEVAASVTGHAETGDADLIDVGGVGGTLAGNALSLGGPGHARARS